MKIVNSISHTKTELVWFRAIVIMFFDDAVHSVNGRFKITTVRDIEDDVKFISAKSRDEIIGAKTAGQ